MLDVIHPLATFLLALFSGALLTEARILVPYWRKMEPEKFFALHSELGPSLFRYFAPLTVLGVVAPFLSATFSDISSLVGQLRAVTAGLCMIVLACFFLYFRTANAKFASHSISNTELSAELARWAAWHNGRTALTLFALSLNIVALSVA